MYYHLGRGSFKIALLQLSRVIRWGNISNFRKYFRITDIMFMYEVGQPLSKRRFLVPLLRRRLTANGRRIRSLVPGCSFREHLIHEIDVRVSPTDTTSTTSKQYTIISSGVDRIFFQWIGAENSCTPNPWF